MVFNSRMRRIGISSTIISLLIVAIDSASIENRRHYEEERPEAFRYLAETRANTYMYPWTCYIYFSGTRAYPGDPRHSSSYEVLSGCSIFSKTWVIASMGNLASPYWYEPHYKIFADEAAIRRDSIMVQAGADYAKYYIGDVLYDLDPDLHSQRVSAVELHVLLDPALATVHPYMETPINEDRHTPHKSNAINPTNITGGDEKMIVDVVAFAVDSVLVKTGEEFIWSPFILSIPIANPNLKALELSLFNATGTLETSAGHVLCSVPVWHRTDKSLYFHEVSYVKRESCQVAWCNQNHDLCRIFPNRGYDVCFASASVLDICDLDRGSALFCPWFDNSVFAIAKHSSNCGEYNVPSVYTLISSVVRFFYVTTSNDFTEDLQTRPVLDDYTTPYDLSFFPKTTGFGDYIIFHDKDAYYD